MLGVDEDIIACGEPDMMQIMEISAIDAIRVKQKEKQKIRQAKEEAKKAAEKAAAAKKMKESGTELIKLEVFTTSAAILADNSASIIVQDVLAERLSKPSDSGDDIQLSDRVVEILKEIHGNF